MQGCGGGGGGGGDPSVEPTDAPPSDLWACTSSRTLPEQGMHGQVVMAPKKGFAVDDISMSQCNDKLTAIWPHASQPVTSFRLFAAWKPDWDEGNRESSWQTLKDLLEKTNGKILLGTEVEFLDDGVTLNSKANDQMWSWALELMTLLGKDRIMGLSIGNEMDNKDATPEFWESGFFEMIKSKVDDMNKAGFTDIPVTVVWSMGAFAQEPFNSRILDLVTQARDTWGNKWVWAFNPYPLWDANLIPTNAEECESKVAAALNIEYTRNVMSNARDRVAQFVGNDDYTLWVTESGWSSPVVSLQTEVAEFCPSWADKESVFTFYQNMMEWDLSLNNGGHGVDHMFYFTMRDACQHGICEGFGLIGSCEDTACKIDDTPALALAIV